MSMLCRALPSKHTHDRCSRMEDELKCPQCLDFFCHPLLLPCSHSMCSGCAEKCQEPSQNFISQYDDATTPVLSDVDSTKDFPDIDKVSLVSETDSGVVCNSRPNSYIGTTSISNIFTAVQGSVFGIKCPVCKKNVFLDENGYNSLPKNKVLEVIVDKYCCEHKKNLKSVSIKCELCEHEHIAKAASVMCEQCEVFYCNECRDKCHPNRGSLAKHNLVDAVQGKAIIRAKNKGKEAKCFEHVEEHLSMFCLLCKVPVCYLCHQEGRHVNHDVQALGAMSKSHKTELSQTLQSLSEKAKSGTEFIQMIRGMADKVPGNAVDFEAVVVAQCDALIEAIRQRKQELLASVSHERELKTRVLKDQTSQCTSLLQRTTGLLHFCIEVLKESDAASFLQVSSGLIGRVSVADQNFNKEMEFIPRISPEFELTLDNKSVMHAIQTMNFFQMKEPNKPTIIPDDCSAENNSVTIAWQPHIGNVVENYSLELDDGDGGDFRVVYIGKETICTVDGLHFNSTYFARVKASNHAGESDYSDPISLQTAEVAWFNLDPSASHPDILFSNENLTVSSNSFDHRVVLGSTGFSKGVHYWEIVVDRYDNNKDPAIGIARFDVDKSAMLGKEDKGWCMYIDNSRSWFMHCDEHEHRTEGGVHIGSVIGVLLDLDKHMLSYYVDEEPHGPIAFTNLHGVFFPAISLNRNVQVTLRTGIVPPVETEEEEEEEGEESP